MLSPLPADTLAFLQGLKARIQQAQSRAALKVNLELIPLFWEIGNDILQRQASEGWGTRVIDRLSVDFLPTIEELEAGLSGEDPG